MIDDRAGEDGLGALEPTADIVASMTFPTRVERRWAWVVGLCSRPWVLWLDDDEIPSHGLLAALPELVSATDVTHYQLRRRWVWPDPGTALAEPPWESEFVPRLFRRDPALVWFPGIFHLPIKSFGPCRWVDAGVYHLDTVLNDVDARRAKAGVYERSRPGIRIVGRPLNDAFYVPESRPEPPRTTPIAAEDADVLRRIVESSSDPIVGAPPTGSVIRGTEEAVDALFHLPDGDVDQGLIEVVGSASPWLAGIERPVEILLHNLGSNRWPPGGLDIPEVNVSYRWYAPDGRLVVDGGLRTPLTAGLAPGAVERVVVEVIAPPTAGDYTLGLDLVREHVRWFGIEQRIDVTVAPRLTVGIVLDDLDEADWAVAVAAFLVDEHPAVTPLLLVRDPGAASARVGYEATHDPHAALFPGAGVVGILTGLGDARTAALPAVDALIVDGDALTGRRGVRAELRHALRLRAARRAGVPAAVASTGAFTGSGRVTRLFRVDPPVLAAGSTDALEGWLRGALAPAHD